MRKFLLGKIDNFLKKQMDNMYTVFIPEQACEVQTLFTCINIVNKKIKKNNMEMYTKLWILPYHQKNGSLRI